MKFYKHNTLTNFTTRLPNSINLTGDWEVGLVEIQYPHNWYNVPSKKRYRSFTLRTKASNDPDGPEGEYQFWITEGYYDNIHLLLAEINREGTKAMLSSKNKLKLFYNPVNRKIGLESDHPCRLIVAPHMRKLLGMEEASLTKNHWQGTQVVDMDAVDSLYIYCDVVEPRVVGDSHVPLLRIVPVEGRHGELVTRIYENIHYVRLQQKNFQTIEVNISDRAGNKVPFEQGTLSVTLHFRQRKRLSTL